MDLKGHNLKAHLSALKTVAMRIGTSVSVAVGRHAGNNVRGLIFSPFFASPSSSTTSPSQHFLIDFASTQLLKVTFSIIEKERAHILELVIFLCLQKFMFRNLSFQINFLSILFESDI